MVFAGLSLNIWTAPSWWSDRGVLINGSESDDYVVINAGQLKHLAFSAKEEMNAKFPGGAGWTINEMVMAWSDTANADDYAAVNAGQLKAVAMPFYDRLIELGQRSSYPWAAAADPDDFSLVNIGQAKNLFSFEINEDLDGDGLQNQIEEAMGLNPLSHDTNGDGVEDGYDDPDGDGWLTMDELALGLDPLANEFTALQVNVVYDNINRLTSVDQSPQGGSASSFTYDSAGNLETSHP